MLFLVIGLVVFGVGLVGFLISFFGSSIDYAHNSTEILNWDVNAGTLVVWGFVSGVLMLAGALILRKGLAWWWRQRKEDRASRKAARQAPPAPVPDEGTH